MVATAAVGDPAPAIVLNDQNNETFDLAEHRGHRVFVYFYPKAMTSGCTTQAQGLRDISAELGREAPGSVIVGISPDPVARLAKFADKEQLGFVLLSDEDHLVADAYGVWVLKKLYGREYMGVQRSGFLIDGDGVITHAWPKISPKDTPTKLLAALQEDQG